MRSGRQIDGVGPHSPKSSASGIPKVLRETQMLPATVDSLAVLAWWQCLQIIAWTIRLGLELRCTLVCLDKWSLRANFFSHKEHS